jgi:hypothetical protein
MQSSEGVKNHDIDSCVMKQGHLDFTYSLSSQSTFRRKKKSILIHWRAKLLFNGGHL